MFSVKIPEIVYRRDAYMTRIKPFMRKTLVKVLVGHRRVGKSFILYQLIDEIRRDEPEANIIYINKEDVAFSEIRTYKELNDYVLVKSVQGRINYIFIDEVQDIEDFSLAVRSLALDEKNDIYLTGSNSDFFSSDLANSLGGRYIIFKIYSLSYSEFLEFHHLSNSLEAFQRYVRYGGLPYLIHLANDERIITEYLRGIQDSIILRDVIRRKNIRNTAFLEQLIAFLAGNIGNLFSSKSISDFLKAQRVAIPPNQVNEYAGALADAFFLHRVGRYDITGKRLFERGEKYYFENLGIRNVIAGYKVDDRASVLENVVCNHLLFRGYDVKIGSVDSREVDFVCKRDNEILYVQVAVELTRAETIEREFGNLLRIKDNYPKIVVTEEDFRGNTYQGVKQVYILDFLTTY